MLLNKMDFDSIQREKRQRQFSESEESERKTLILKPFFLCYDIEFRNANSAGH